MNPRRGEIWLADLNPTIGAEIRKTRPVVVVWHVKLEPDFANRLTKPSAVDTLQLRGIDTVRFVRRVGEVPLSIMNLIVTAIAAVIEYDPILP